MLLDRLYKAAARVVLVSYTTTHLLAPLAHACEMPEISTNRSSDNLLEALKDNLSLKESEDIGKEKTSTISGTRSTRSNSFNFSTTSETDYDYAEDYQYRYRLRVKNLDPKTENFQLKLSRKEKGSTGKFEKLHTSTINKGVLTTTNSDTQDVLLNLFRGATPRHFTKEADTICFMWDVSNFGTLKLGRDGSVFFDQGSKPILLAYDLILKTSGELFLQSLGVSELTLQSPQTNIIGAVSTNRLHMDHNVINWGGLQTKQLTGQGTFTNHALLKLDGTSDQPAIMGVRHLVNKKGEGVSKEAKIESTHLNITSDNQSFINEEDAEISVEDTLLVDSAISSSFINRGVLRLHKTTLNREASNEGSWQAHQMIVEQGCFTNQEFGTLNILDQLTITSNLINEGDITAKNLLKLEKGVNKGSIKAKDAMVAGEFVNSTGSKLNTDTLELYKNGKFINSLRSSLTIHKELKADDALLQNDGKMLTEGNLTQKTGKLINTGKWDHIGDLDLGSTELINDGKMAWQKGIWDFSPLKQYVNNGEWVLDQMVCRRPLTIHNCAALYLQNGQLTFDHLINHQNLVLSAGQYSVTGSFQNNHLMSFMDKDWTFTDDLTSTAPNRLVIKEIDDAQAQIALLADLYPLLTQKEYETDRFKKDILPKLYAKTRKDYQSSYEKYISTWSSSGVYPPDMHIRDVMGKSGRVLEQWMKEVTANYSPQPFDKLYTETERRVPITKLAEKFNISYPWGLKVFDVWQASPTVPETILTPTEILALKNKVQPQEEAILNSVSGTTSVVGPTGEIEADEDLTLTYDVKAFPKLIRSNGDVVFSPRYRKVRNLMDLEKVTTPGKVSFNTSAVTVSQNHEFAKIGHLELIVDGFFKIIREFKTPVLTLYVEGDLTIGTSNDVMGTLAATKGPLILTAHTIDGRFAKIYGAGPTHIKSTKGDTMLGADNPLLYRVNCNTSGPHECAHSFRIKNGAYIASGNTLTLDSSKDILIDFGELYSRKNQALRATNLIRNLAGKFVSEDEITIKSKQYLHSRKKSVYMMVIDALWGNHSHTMPGSDAAYLDALGDIHLDANRIDNISSNIKSGGNIYIQNTKVSKGEKPPSGVYYSRIDGVSSYEWMELLRAQGHLSGGSEALPFWRSVWGDACIVQAGENIHIDTGNFVIAGNMNSPVIAIQATGDGFFHNTNRNRQTTTPTGILHNLTQGIQHQAKGNGFLRLASDGEVRTEFPFGTPYAPDLSRMPMLETDSPMFIPNPINIFNPLRNLSSNFINLSIQSALSELAGKVYLKEGRGKNLLKALEDNAFKFRQKTGKNILTRDDIKGASDAMLIYGFKPIDGINQLQTFLCLPPDEINPYQDSGDISGNKITIKTIGNQTHRNNRIVARDILNAVSTKGSVSRETEKYTVHYGIEDGSITQDVSMPQQYFGCERGDINVYGYKDVTSVGVRTESGRDFNETAKIGIIKKDPLILSQTIQINKEEDDGWFSTKTTSETNTSHIISPTTTRAGRNIKETAGKGIHLIGAKEIAEEDLIYNGPSLTTEASMVVNTNSKTSTTSGMFSDRTDSSSFSTISAESTELKSKRIFINSDSATFRGTDFIALILEDNTKEGSRFGPSIGKVNYSQRSMTESALSSSDIGCEGWYEVMQPCRFAINQIIRKIDTGEIKLESVVWDKDRTQIIGKFAETTYELKKHHTEWAIHEQVIPTEALVVVALAVTLMTQGVGVKFLSPMLKGITAVSGMQLSAMGVAMVNAGFTAVCAQSTTSFLGTGDLAQVGKDLSSSSSIRSLGISMLSAGLCQSIGASLNIDMNPGLTELINPEKQVQFMDFLQANALKTVIDTPLQSVIGQKPIEDSVMGGIKSLGVNTVASYFAHHIGKIYGKDQMTYLEHKGIHGGLGAVSGWLLNPTQKGLISGGIGGIVSEVVMDGRREIAKEKAINIIAQAEKQGIPLEAPDFKRQLYESLSGELAFAKLSGATVAALLGQDPSVAFQTGTNAVENNAIMLAVGVAVATYEVYQVYKIYEREGAKAALQQLAIDGAITIATVGVGKVIYNVGKLSAPMAEKVWKIYVAQNPAFAQVASRVWGAIGHGLGKAKDFYHRTDDALDSLWNKGKQKLGFGTGNRNIEALDLVESSKIGRGANTNAPEKLHFDYSDPESAFSLPIDTITGRGPMHVDSRQFTKAESLTSKGESRNAEQFWNMWNKKYPGTISADNFKLMHNKSHFTSPRVDEQWVSHFPEHKNYLGDVLIHHHIDHGNLVTGLPESVHSLNPGRGYFHQNMGGNKK